LLKDREKEQKSKLKTERHKRDTTTATTAASITEPAPIRLSFFSPQPVLSVTLPSKRQSGTQFSLKSNDTSYPSRVERRTTAMTSLEYSDEVHARNFQEEDDMMSGLDDETYAKILQDVEYKKSALRHTKMSNYGHYTENEQSSSNELLSALHSISIDVESPPRRVVSVRNVVPHPLHSARRTVDSIDMSYESLVQLEDVPCGLSPEVIERIIPQFTITPSMEILSCAICLTDYNVGDVAAAVPSCLHRFHYECLVQWLALKKACPICKEEIV